ncbi:hypothetical protein D9611_010540 [Ephemerocybe angulata]|uniref:Uncharacterized protein n=1 Tax=Ephemerocybe angulata TaxID=980116 RepID=A0A8H5FAT7_9AGAR|nr:hypothetical protein D9611_010540 [Tulosesus angulatus]
MPYIVVDDARLIPGVHLIGTQWTREPRIGAVGAHNATITTGTPLDGSSFQSSPELRFPFTGPEFTLVGRPTAGLQLEYKIDGGPVQPCVLNFTDSDIGKSGVVLWSMHDIPPTPLTRAGGSHNVSLFLPTDSTGQLHIDYVRYRPVGTEIAGPIALLVDNKDTDAIQYDRLWPPAVWEDGKESLYFPGKGPNGKPVSGSWARANEVGQTFVHSFQGNTTVSVYGAVGRAPGRLSITYSLNGTPQSDRIEYANGSQAIDRESWNITKLYELPAPVGGTKAFHELRVTVVEATEEQAFYFDYLTYETNQETVTPFSGNSPAPTPTSVSDSSGSGQLSVGKIVGGVVGGLLFLVVVWRLVRFERARKYSDQTIALQVMQARETQAQARAAERARRGGNAQPEGADEDFPPPPWSPPQGPLNEPPPPMPEAWLNTSPTPATTANTAVTGHGSRSVISLGTPSHAYDAAVSSPPPPPLPAGAQAPDPVPPRRRRQVCLKILRLAALLQRRVHHAT